MQPRPLAVTIVFVFLLGCIACSDTTYETLKTFKEHTDAADRAELARDYSKAEQHYLDALEVAENGKWKGGVVTAKRNLAAIYRVRKNFPKAEAFLTEAKNVCRTDPECVGLGTIYDQLVFMYLFDIGDLQKALAVIDDLISSNPKLDDGVVVKDKVLKYADEIRSLGFAVEASALEERVRNL
jgi:tetratricopeptide (TPR) repeat protein